MEPNYQFGIIANYSYYKETRPKMIREYYLHNSEKCF